jgi:hypothetical protein
MILLQRRRHLLIWLVLGPLILIGFAIGLCSRRDVPTQEAGFGAVAAEVRP